LLPQQRVHLHRVAVAVAALPVEAEEVEEVGAGS
jgi:hypothetical protein